MPVEALAGYWHSKMHSPKEGTLYICRFHLWLQLNYKTTLPVCNTHRKNFARLIFVPVNFDRVCFQQPM